MLSITKNKTKKSASIKRPETVLLRRPVLVYNSRVDSLLKDISIEAANQSSLSNLTSDWMIFMDELNTRMFDKISF